jgi:hypothetical protein
MMEDFTAHKEGGHPAPIISKKDGIIYIYKDIDKTILLDATKPDTCDKCSQLVFDKVETSGSIMLVEWYKCRITGRRKNVVYCRGEFVDGRNHPCEVETK